MKPHSFSLSTNLALLVSKRSLLKISGDVGPHTEDTFTWYLRTVLRNLSGYTVPSPSPPGNPSPGHLAGGGAHIPWLLSPPLHSVVFSCPPLSQVALDPRTHLPLTCRTVPLSPDPSPSFQTRSLYANLTDMETGFIVSTRCLGARPAAAAVLGYPGSFANILVPLEHDKVQSRSPVSQLTDSHLLPSPQPFRDFLGGLGRGSPSLCLGPFLL